MKNLTAEIAEVKMARGLKLRARGKTRLHFLRLFSGKAKERIMVFGNDLCAPCLLCAPFMGFFGRGMRAREILHSRK
jgi:hypothetical protein